MTMDNMVTRMQFSNEASNSLSQAQYIYRYILQILQSITMKEKQLSYISLNPHIDLNDLTQRNAELMRIRYEIQQENERLHLNLTQMINYLVNATDKALRALLISLHHKDSINIILDDNLLGAICSFAELIGNTSNAIISYKHICLTNSINYLLSDVGFNKNNSALIGYERINRLIRS